MAKEDFLVDLLDTLSERVYPFHIKRAMFLCRAYPERFRPHNFEHYTETVRFFVKLEKSKQSQESENNTMPKMPAKFTPLEDGVYSFLIDTVETVDGKFGKQEQVHAVVLDDDANPTDQSILFWIGHKSYKTIKSAMAADMLDCEWDEEADPEEDDPSEWEVKNPAYFRGVVADGKIVKFSRYDTMTKKKPGNKK